MSKTPYLKLTIIEFFEDDKGYEIFEDGEDIIDGDVSSSYFGNFHDADLEDWAEEYDREVRAAAVKDLDKGCLADAETVVVEAAPSAPEPCPVEARAQEILAREAREVEARFQAGCN